MIHLASLSVPFIFLSVMLRSQIECMFKFATANDVA